MPYLLDADSASLAINGNKRVRNRIKQTPQVWLSAIAAEEILSGALSLINQTRDKAGNPAAYTLFGNLLNSFSDYKIHAYTAEAMVIYASLPASVKRVERRTAGLRPAPSPPGGGDGEHAALLADTGRAV